jgi:hypothetical protein
MVKRGEQLAKSNWQDEAGIVILRIGVMLTF